MPGPDSGNCASKWFHGSISREDSERLLSSQPFDGFFLIRFSISTMKYVLSIVFQRKFYHYPIEELSDGFYQVHGTKAKYLGIDLLVSEFRQPDNDIVCPLTKPIPGSKPPSHIVVYGFTNELHHAIRRANLKNVRDLLNKISHTSPIRLKDYINEKSADTGATPLIDAAKTGSNDIVRLLLQHGALVNLRDCAGFSALHRACQRSFAHVAETLLLLGNANPQIKCPFSGHSPLHEAAMLGHIDCCQCLLRHHAAPWARNHDSEMPCELAARYGFSELAHNLACLQLPPVEIINKSNWYHPHLTKGATEQYFSDSGTLEDGCFLVRKSSQSDRKFVLILSFQTQALKYEIEVGDFSFLTEIRHAFYIDKGPLHPSLEHLIEHYSRFLDGIPVLLKIAVTSNGKLVALKDSSSKRQSNCSDKSLRMNVATDNSTISLLGSVNNTGLVKTNSNLISSGNINIPSDVDIPPLISSDSVVLLCRLGEGEFGEVYRGRVQLPDGIKDVAIKVLVQGSQRLDFLKEATVMMKLRHPNIITIYGLCENKRLMMLLELSELGSLLDYLLNFPEICLFSDLCNWAMQIAQGMNYLESTGFVHRDLACRNVLLANHYQAKISDFGLSRAVTADTDYYKATQRGKWPVKWYAPESIYYKTFSHASDVWSFGVCLWEMFTKGEHPYSDLDSIEVLRQIEEGIRLPKPPLAPEEIFAIMHDCWAYNPEARPTFSQLVKMFEHLTTNVYENVELPQIVNSFGKLEVSADGPRATKSSSIPSAKVVNCQ